MNWNSSQSCRLYFKLVYLVKVSITLHYLSFAKKNICYNFERVTQATDKIGILLLSFG